MAGRFRGYLERFLTTRRRETAIETASDSELLRRFVKSGDQESFELLVWRHGVMVLGVCQRQIRDNHLAEDAFQAVFLVLARKATAIRGSNVAGWLFRVARRVASRAVLTRIPTQELPEIPIEQPGNPIEREELARLLDNEVARLPERLRQPVLLCYLGGRSTEDAARELGCPRGTVLSRLSSARKMLADRLGRNGVTLPAALTVIGIELNGRIVSATMHASLQFVQSQSPLDSASLLAHGVIRTMKQSKQLTVLSGILVATSLIGGVGWVTAKSSSGERTTELPITQNEPKVDLKKNSPETARVNAINDGFVRAEQPKHPPEVLEGVVEILNLDPVIAEALKSNPKDSQLRKLQKEVCFNLGVYMAKIEILIEIGKWNPQDFDQAIKVAVSLPKNLLELMEKPEDKLKCYELEVKLLKGFYQFTDTRVVVGSDPSQNRDVAKATLLEAEVKLLKLKLEIEKARK